MTTIPSLIKTHALTGTTPGQRDNAASVFTEMCAQAPAQEAIQASGSSTAHQQQCEAESSSRGIHVYTPANTYICTHAHTPQVHTVACTQTNKRKFKYVCTHTNTCTLIRVHKQAVVLACIRTKKNMPCTHKSRQSHIHICLQAHQDMLTFACPQANARTCGHELKQKHTRAWVYRHKQILADACTHADENTLLHAHKKTKSHVCMHAYRQRKTDSCQNTDKNTLNDLTHTDKYTLMHTRE